MSLRQGDIVLTNFNPQSGHEQAGYRPAVVVSNRIFNTYSNLTLLCPVTHTDRHSPFHVEITGNPHVNGFILCDQVKMIDLRARGFRKISELDRKTLLEVLTIIQEILEPEM